MISLQPPLPHRSAVTKRRLLFIGRLLQLSSPLGSLLFLRAEEHDQLRPKRLTALYSHGLPPTSRTQLMEPVAGCPLITVPFRSRTPSSSHSGFTSTRGKDVLKEEGEGRRWGTGVRCVSCQRSPRSKKQQGNSMARSPSNSRSGCLGSHRRSAGR
ncbi:hypothetical protein EYF80_059458 [Liparis tanakae]|uniref:Uncharacterized protein n=1 Tax=Liparis tanakae TaxID=230148 RepID=A0A4Z2EPB7_9TELE|nr:hypothetical protein EYF80_059458 [Liparis tanakae]